MRALTFSEFKQDCPVLLAGSCSEKCSMDTSMCRHLYKEAIGPDLARQIEEQKKRDVDGSTK